MQLAIGRLAIGMIVMVWSSVACHAQTPRAGKVAAVPDDSAIAIAGDADLRLDPAVPSPREVLGFEVGARPVRYLEMKQYLHRLAEASDRLELRQYGRTHEARTLYYMVISDAANMRRIEDIRSGLASLADPRGTSEEQARELIETSPAVAWMSYSVHGDELSSTDAAVLLIYRLAAGQDEATKKLLQGLVICVDPLQNPDGRERFMSMMQQLHGRVPSPDTQSAEHTATWPGGRTNHYLFDLNRDWNMTVQPESRGRVAAIASWHPQLLVDSHEMGATSTYLFSPPREPLNLHITASVLRWMDKYSLDQAAAFDRHGWSYYRGEWNEGWAIGFADIWAKHHGAVGMLYEQAGSEGTVVRLPTEQDRHYAEDVAHQYVSSVANLTTLAEHRREILADFYADKKRAVADEVGRGKRNLFLFVPGEDRTRAADFLAMLQRQNIETFALTEETSLNDVVDHWGTVSERKAFPAGTVVIPMAQPLSPLARAMLEFDPRLSDDFLKTERRELELKNRSRFYDVSGWCVSMCYDVEGYWARSPSPTPGIGGAAGRQAATPDAILQAGSPGAGDAVPRQDRYGYLIDGGDEASIRLVGRLLQAGWKVRVGQKPFTNTGRSFPPGSFLIRLHENQQTAEALEEQLGESPAGLWTAAGGARSDEGSDLGGGRFPLLAEPRIALAFASPFSSNSAGAIWHLLDSRLGLRVSRLSGSRLGYADLRKYNVIVLPSAWGGALARVLNKGTLGRLEAWVKDGGTLVAIGRSAAVLAKAEGGLGSVRLRRNVLAELDVYREDAGRQRSANEPQFDLSQVWDFSPDKKADSATTQPSESGKDRQAWSIAPTKDAKALERWDGWAMRFMPRGVLLRADLHPEHWLAHGMGHSGRVPVMYGSSQVFMAMNPVQTIARLARPESLRLSGLLWPEARERLADGAYMTRERIGRGQIILFATDPVFRGYMRGTTRLFLNAVILGPGVGASTPMPW